MAEQNGTNTGKCAEEYVVKRGDSFYLIAHKLGVPLRDLLAANRDIHPARLMVGDVLCVPREEDDSPQTGGLGSSTNGGVSSTTQSRWHSPDHAGHRHDPVRHNDPIRRHDNADHAGHRHHAVRRNDAVRRHDNADHTGHRAPASPPAWRRPPSPPA